jgi:hypothetical protein
MTTICNFMYCHEFHFRLFVHLLDIREHHFVALLHFQNSTRFPDTQGLLE